MAYAAGAGRAFDVTVVGFAEWIGRAAARYAVVKCQAPDGLIRKE